MSRALNTATLDGAARDYAGQFLLQTIWSPTNHGVAIGGREWVLQNLFNATYMDEHQYLLKAMRDYLGRAALADLDGEAAKRFTPRSEAVFRRLLADKLAIDPDGAHIPGKIGSVVVGSRDVGQTVIEVETPASLRRRALRGLGKEHRETYKRIAAARWHIYAGEDEERAAGSGVADPLPVGQNIVGALHTRISNESAIAGLNALLALLNEGSTAGFIQGRSGSQPADPDTAVSGTLLFTLLLTDPAFPTAVDLAPGARATASTITNDTSADDTLTLGYCRGSASNDSGATALDDHIDGEAGTSGADFNFNTLSIVSGATVSMTSWTVTLPEG